MEINTKDLNKDELLLLLNESALCILIETGGKFRNANRFFL